MQKVKIFKDKDIPNNYLGLESWINGWIKENSNYRIISISGTEYHDKMNKNVQHNMCYVLYEDSTDNK